MENTSNVIHYLYLPKKKYLKDMSCCDGLLIKRTIEDRPTFGVKSTKILRSAFSIYAATEISAY